MDSPNSSWIPEGYVEVIANGQHYLVPQFVAPALNVTWRGYDNGTVGSSKSFFISHLFRK